MRAALRISPMPGPPAPGSLADVVYEQIKDDLFEFRLLPGDLFTEADIAQRLGVSRTPVRLGLARLEREGFLLARPRAGWQVRPFDFERFEALYDLRIVLEQAAVERLCARGPMDLAGLLGALQDVWFVPPGQRIGDGRLVAQLDEAFHCSVVAAAGNAEMAQVHREVTEKIRIIRRLDFTKDFRVDATYDEHAAILRAILARRAAEAARMLRAHIELSKSVVRKITVHMLHEARDRAG
ncbi:GntR family transcriptional regulator [Bordetella hinzii]|uniref:GntR family transcriptional regulator n=2 Tax=Bordetella hinzii TaxID=103855 RepID=A0AAN1RT12_9BORD|nr:GntR family transcriptional regulator [Bordetella hinzii]KXA70797.1 GntR family transcriptional regulator [Bordetella hinzii LMG 13501]MBZ0076825.1 GntR family transcriptional regulator [Bordetella hinzii]MBZ0078884.1 GntR family transcriptional regulator [Bordetella hinzii]MBZ0083488.1 GntR family transcriptional regulator [Bordetella hinzii]